MIYQIDHYDGVRQDIFKSLQNYACIGCPTGSFLEAVLCNDLKEAVGRADDDNARALLRIVSLVYNHMPSNAWGSPEKVEAWITAHREKREAQRDATP